jgi:outer membrane lipoprotein carrier protein
MTKKIIAMLLAACFSASIYAQKDAQAKDVLDKVSQQTKAHPTIEVEFVITLENMETATKDQHKGKLWLKGQKYKLEIFSNTLYCDGTTIWTFAKSTNEVNITDAADSEESILNPATMLTIYEKGYKYKYVAERFERGRAIHVVDLFPEDVAGSDYSKIRLSIDKDKNQMVSAHYFSKDETRVLVEVVKFTPGTPMDDSMFVFKKSNYPGAAEIDLR